MGTAVPLAKALAMLLLAGFVLGGTLSDGLNRIDMSDDVLFQIGRVRARLHAKSQSHNRDGQLSKAIKSLGQMGALRLNRQSAQLFAKEVAVAGWLSNVPCSVARHSSNPGQISNNPDFWQCVEYCLRVEFGWFTSIASELPHLLQVRSIWGEPALLSVNRRSWSLMDAADLAPLFQSKPEEILPRCVAGAPVQTPDDFGGPHEQRAERINDLLRAMSSSAFSIEQLHLGMHDHDPQLTVNAQQREQREKMPQSGLLTDASFSTLAKLLLKSPHLRDLSVSWDVAAATDATVRHAAAIATTIRSTSVRQLSILNTCRGYPSDADPLAALVDALDVGDDWRMVESLSITRHHCWGQSDIVATRELKALPLLVARMPALRRVHLEYHGHTPDNEWYPALCDIAPLVPDHVTVTITTNQIGFAGLERTATLAPLRDASSDGYAVVLPVPTSFLLHHPANDHIELVGRTTLLETTALTIIPGHTDASQGVIIRVSFGDLATLVPKMERLAIDSRWTESFCHDVLKQVPPEVGGGLRALMLHTIRLPSGNGGWENDGWENDGWENDGWEVFENLERLLQAGHDISVVDLGLAIPRNVTTTDAVLVDRLALALSRMPRLEHLRLVLTVADGFYDGGRINALYARFVDVLPFARVAVLKSAHPPPDYQYFDRHTLPVAWRLNLTAAVPPTPEFPSPWDFYGKLHS